MVLLLRKLYVYFNKDPKWGSTIFQGWGSNLFQGGGGPNANFYRNPYNLLFSSGGVRTHYPPLDPYMANVVITG